MPESVGMSVPDTCPPIVLLVEDDNETREACDLLLRDEGLWTVPVRQPIAAMPLARQLRPDVIVTGIGIPGAADVFTMVSRLRQDSRTRHIPVIALTGYSGAVTPGPAFRRVLLKPIDPTALLANVQEVLEWAREVRTRAGRMGAHLPDARRPAGKALVGAPVPARRRSGSAAPLQECSVVTTANGVIIQATAAVGLFLNVAHRRLEGRNIFNFADADRDRLYAAARAAEETSTLCPIRIRPREKRPMTAFVEITHVSTNCLQWTFRRTGRRERCKAAR